MQLNRTWKLATGLMVLMLLATPFLAIVPYEVSAATPGNDLSIIVYDENTADPVVGAKVALIGVHQQSPDPKTTGPDGLAVFTPYDGYYTMTVTCDDYYTYQSDSVIRFTDLLPSAISVPMSKMSADRYALTVNVNGTAGALDGASVVVKTVVDNATTSISDIATGGTAQMQLPNGTYTIVCSNAAYATDVESDVVINGANVTKDITLSAAAKFNGLVTMDGAPATGVVAYLVGDDPLVETDRKIIKASGTSPFFSFDAFVGNFTLLVDADGALAAVEAVTVNASNPLKTVALSKQSAQTEENAFAFDANDWNVATLTKTMVLDHDNTVPGLDYAYLPSAKMQIDLVFGNGDGEVNASELDAFKAKMVEFGPIDVTTVGMLSVNGVNMISDVADPAYNITGLLGMVSDTGGFQVQMVAGYSTIDEVTNGAPTYPVAVTAQKTLDDMSYTYKVAFPSLYEKVGSATIAPSGSGVTVTGYAEIVVTSGTSVATATVSVHESVAPSAAAAIMTGVDAYKVMNGSEFLHYIVAQDANVTFTASGSVDPNGNPLMYIWDFGDGNSSGEITNLTCIHSYAIAEQYTVNLTVKDQAGLMAYSSFDVKVDGVDPTVAAMENVTALGATLNVDQNKAYSFNSADSADMLNETEAGLIASYKWVWGDGNTTTVLMGENQTVSHTWANAGVFTMYLNVTDVANHTSSKNVTVTVKDTVKPTVKFSVKLNDTVVTSAKENQTLTFDASASSDASGIASYLWDFGDGTNSTLASPTHSYSSIKTFSVKLTLTDNAGNVANTTYSLKIESSSRPDLRVGSVTFDPTKFTEGEDGFIYVNVTNVGTAKAEGIYAQLWKVNLDGSRSMLTDVSVLLVNDSEAYSLDAGQSGLLRMKHSFSATGDYTLQVNVSANDEVSSKMTDNSATVSLTVDEAGWKAWLLYGGIFAVIIVVVVLFLFRKKLPMMSGKKKGPSPPSKKK